MPRHEASSDRRHGDRREHEQEQVALSEQQCVADHLGARHPAPGENDAEHDPDSDRHTTAAHQVTASIRTDTTIAVAKNVAVAATLAGDSEEIPLSPLPDVQPPASFAP